MNLPSIENMLLIIDTIISTDIYIEDFTVSRNKLNKLIILKEQFSSILIINNNMIQKHSYLANEYFSFTKGNRFTYYHNGFMEFDLSTEIEKDEWFNLSLMENDLFDLSTLMYFQELNEELNSKKYDGTIRIFLEYFKSKNNISNLIGALKDDITSIR